MEVIFFYENVVFLIKSECTCRRVVCILRIDATVLIVVLLLSLVCSNVSQS